MKNKPYVKEISIVDGKEVITNPITIDTPYLHSFTSQAQRKASEKYVNVYTRGFGWNRVLRSKYFSSSTGTIQRTREESLEYEFSKQTRKLVNAEIKNIIKSLSQVDSEKPTSNEDDNIVKLANECYKAGYLDYHLYLKSLKQN